MSEQDMQRQKSRKEFDQHMAAKRSALRDAVRQRDKGAISTLLEKGFDPCGSSKEQTESPLGLAIRARDVEIVALLLGDPAGSLRRIAIRGWHVDYYPSLAMQLGFGDVLELFAQHGYDLNNQAQTEKQTLLTLAIRHDQLLPAPRCVDAALQAGADPNQPNGHDVSPLILAVGNKQVAAARSLIAAGADLHHRDMGVSPLGMACMIESLKMGMFDAKSHAVIDLLLEAGVDVTQLTRKEMVGNTPSLVSLPFALVHQGDSQALEYLIRKGALDVNLRSQEFPDELTFIQDAITLLGYAVYTNKPAIARILIKHGAEVNAGWLENTAVSYAQSHGECKQELFTLLAHAGADLCAPVFTEDGENIHPRSYESLAKNESLAEFKKTQSALKQWISKHHAEADFEMTLIANGRPSETLLRICAYGQLPELASLEVWQRAPERGMALWRNVCAALPPYWQARAHDLDIQPLQQAMAMPEKYLSFKERVKPKIEGRTR